MNIHLTPKEQVILELLVERGLSNKQLARHLHCTESTIKLHVSNLLEKYGARNRLQLVIFAGKVA
jgi:DNA-binding NarL/FixJ family response regulator